MPDDDDDLDGYLSRIDLDAVADRHDKVNECEFFLALALCETDREKFRWLVSAFLGAAYSYFETSALWACVNLTDENGDPHEDTAALAILRKYIKVTRNLKRSPYFVNTAGHVDLTKQLYKFRKETTHYFALSVMTTGEDLPREFHFGSEHGRGTPALEFCDRAMALIRVVQQELDA